MKNNNTTTLNLNINKDDAAINDFMYCWSQFGQRPNKTLLHDSYPANDFLEIINENILKKNTFTEVLPDSDCHIINVKSLIQLTESVFVSYILIDQNQPDSVVSDLTFFYKNDSDKEFIDPIIDKLLEDSDFEVEIPESHKLNTISISNSGLELERVETKLDIDTFELYYNSKTMKNIKSLTKKLKKSTKGISIFYGPRGTGKSSIIHLLSNKLEKTVIFIPNNSLEHTINNPDFRKFLKKTGRVLLVLDDCEMSFNEYFVKSNFIVNNLIQLVDGFISDSLDINIITIFNVESTEEIDHNLLDCNNLLETIEFLPLQEDEANELSEHLNEKVKYKKETKLIDIIKKRKVLNNKKLGF